VRWLLSAVFMALWTLADVLLNEAALRQALAELILRRAQSMGAPVLLDQSVDVSWRFFLVSAPFMAFFIQLAVYGAWISAYRLGGCGRRGFAAALAVVAAVTAVLWLYGLRVVFFMGYIPIEQPLMYFTVNAGLAFIKYSECARPPGPAPG
jgi:hypothetical protein